MNIKNSFKFIFLLLLLLPVLAQANVGIGKPNTAGSTVLVIWNSDGGWDAEIADTGSTSLYNMLTSTGAAYTAGVGFNFTVTTLQVAPNYNIANTWATATSAIQDAITATTIQPLVSGTGNPTYCIIFDMRFMQTNNPPTAHPGEVAGDTISQGDINLYKAYLAAGGSLFIMGDNYWGGAENGFITREENMYQMLNAVASVGIGPNSNNILSPGVVVDPANAVAGAPYSLDTNYNTVTGLSMTTDFAGPIDNSAGGLGSGKSWVVMTADNNPNDVLVAAWSGAAGDLQVAYNKGSMMYWGDSNVLQDWATSGAGQPVVSEFMENAITWLYNGNCCTPPTSLACPGGTAVTVTAGNPNLVSCFESGLNGWTGDGGVWDGTKSFEPSGGSAKDVLPTFWSAAAVFTSPTFAAGTLTPYEGICFEMMNSTGTALTFELHGAGTAWPNQISNPTTFNVPSDGAWHNICLSFANDYTVATNVQIYLDTATGESGGIWLDSVQLQSGCSPNPMVADPNCCGVVDTPTFTNTATKTYTATFTSTPTSTFTKTFTSTFTNTFTATPTNTLANSPTFTNTYTNTSTSTFTNTPVNTFTFTNTYTSTPTSTFTNTPVNTFTFTNTYTNTPTLTFTNTPVNTFTFTNTYTSTPTSTFTNTPVNTFTFTNTYTNTPTSTFTNTPVNTFTFTNTFTSTPTATFTSTPVNTFTFTNTFTITPTNTPTMTFTLTPTPASSVGMGKTVSETRASAGDVLTYDIAVTVTGNSLTNPVITDNLPPNMTFQAFLSFPSGAVTQYNAATDQLQWTLPSPLAANVYNLTYQLKVNTFAPANVPLTNNVQFTYAGLARPITASVPVTVIGNFSVAVNIYNSAGEIVKTIPIQQFSTAINNIVLSKTNTITTLTGPGSTIEILFNGYVIGVWDGTNNSDQPVSNGSYRVQVDNVGSSGVVTSVSQTAIVSRNLSNVEVDIFNGAGEVVRKLYYMVANPTTSNMTNVTLSSTVLRPNTNNIQGSPTVSQLQILVQDTNAPVTLIWDGTADSGTYVTPGQYEIQVHWTNGNGTTTDITRTIMVLTNTGASGIAVARPNILNAMNGMTTTFDATGVVNVSSLKVKIYTIAGELVQSFVSGTPTASWNASGMASGIYIANVEMDSANGGVVNQQRLKILVLH